MLKRQICFFILAIGLSASLLTCKTDYRTDYEKNNGIELTPYQIEVRKEIKRANRAARVRDMMRENEQMRIRRILNCPSPNYLDCWW